MPKRSSLPSSWSSGIVSSDSVSASYSDDEDVDQLSQIGPKACCPRTTKLQCLGAELVQLASQLQAGIVSLGLSSTLGTPLQAFATALGNIGYALQSSPCCEPPKDLFCLINCLLAIVINLLLAAGAVAAPGVSFQAVLALLARIQCLLSPLTGGQCGCSSFASTSFLSGVYCCQKTYGGSILGGGGKLKGRCRQQPPSACFEKLKACCAEKQRLTKTDPCSVVCSAIFQAVAAVLAILSGFVAVAGSQGPTPPPAIFSAIQLLSSALSGLAHAILTPDNSILGCAPSVTSPCFLPCTIGSALTQVVPVLAIVITSEELAAFPNVITILVAVQNAINTLTGIDCLPKHLSPCVPVSAAVQGALVALQSALQNLLLQARR